MTFSILEQSCIQLGFIILFISSILYWAQIIYSGIKINRILTTRIMLVVNINITFLLCFRWISSGHLPFSNLYETSMFLSWILITVNLLLEHFTENNWLGAIIVPSAMLTYAFATLGLPKELQKATALVPALQSNWLMMHVSMMMLSYGTLLSGSLLAVTLLIVYYGSTVTKYLTHFSSQTKIKQDLVLYFFTVRKKSLILQLDYWSYRTIGLGFPLLTTGILSGAVWANEAWGSYWSWDPKEVWALITWLIFAAYLHVRITKDWSSHKSAIVASLGFILVWTCYLGVNLLGKGLHSYGWLT